MFPFFRVLDLEATDFAPAGVPVEIGMCDLHQLAQPGPTGSRFAVLGPIATLLNPMVPIPPQTSAVHHIVDEDVALAPRFEDVVGVFTGAPDVLAYVAHNIGMERHYLGAHTGNTPWICTWKCALHLWPDAPSHSNQALRYWLKPDCLNREMATPAHRAGPDAYVTAFLLEAMLQAATLQQLIDWTNMPALLVRIPFGNLKGRPWTEADDGFLDWVLERDFDEDVMFTAAHHRDQRQAQRATEAAA